jgi:2'-5' RNA ligase
VISEFLGTLAAHGIDADRHELGYAPHITLATYPDDTPSDRLCGALDQVAHCWEPLPISLSGFGIFPGPPASLWVAPVVTSALLERHAALHAALAELQPHAHYRLGAWVPHVTLSGALNDPDRALAAVLPLWRPLTGLLDQLDLVRFRPVEVIERRKLKSAGL